VSPNAEPRSPSARRLAVAVVLAAAHGAWATFEWVQLLSARRGGTATCLLGDGDACTAAWDSAFAGAVHARTGLPVAGWGLAWSVAALALPLAAWVRGARGGATDPFWSGARWLALAGIAAVLGLASVLARLGTFCGTCAVTYALVLAYAATCLTGPRPARAAFRRGAGAAVLATALGWVVLLAPGLWTPRAGEESSVTGVAPNGLGPWLASLPATPRQVLSDTLALTRSHPVRSLPAPVSLLGSPTAPVRITAFSDALCIHCAQLHFALVQMRERLPPGTFAIESRHFPLDGTCNPQVPRVGDGLRCLAARAVLCVEEDAGDAAGFSFSGRLFEERTRLDPARVRDLAREFVDPAWLERCLADPAIEARLQRDIALATELGIQGTPLVLVNGRETPNFPPLLEALILASGDPSHAAFASLPPPRVPDG
jgi:protein-disulfide isomerase